MATPQPAPTPALRLLLDFLRNAKCSQVRAGKQALTVWAMGRYATLGYEPQQDPPEDMGDRERMET